MATNLTAECKAGYQAPITDRPPYLFSSAAWLGFMAGRQVAAMSGIKRASMGRGYTVNIETTGGNRVVVAFAKPDLTTMTVTRL